MKIAYLMNQHPYPSCTFIRREIYALEAKGISVARFSIRRTDLDIKDEADQLEIGKTYYILEQGIINLFLSVIWVIFTYPLKFKSALGLTLKIGQKSERGIIINLIYLVEACLLLKCVKKLEIDHIHSHFATNATTVAMLCKTLGGPEYSFTVHGPHDFDQPIGLGIPEKIEKSAFVVAISSFTKGQLYRWCSYTQWSKIHIIHCGLDDLFLKQSFVPLPKDAVFICVGRFSEQKGHLILVEAAKIIAEAGLKFKIVLVGDGELRQEIETLIDKYGLKQFFDIKGWLTGSEVVQEILKAQVMVLPSFAEGLPVVIMESFALYRPVISTYIAGIPELVEANECGWLAISGSVDSLAEAMTSAIQTPVEQLTEMGKNGFVRVSENYKVSTETEKLVSLLTKYSQHCSA